MPVDRSGARNGEPIVLATSNGTGMGHLTRQLAVARSLQPDRDPVFFSLSQAVGVIEHYGFPGEYCPSRERGWMPHVRWQDYLRDRLRAFVAETGASTLVFDGVVPYLGLLEARRALPEVAFVWMRRGFWRPGVRTTPLRSARTFDLVLEPGDLAAAGDHGATADRDDAVRLPPISLTEHLDPLPRAQASAALGLDPDRPTALVTLSSGALNDVATPGAAAVAALLSDPTWQVAVTRSALTKGGIPIDDPSRCIELSGVYPLAQYLAAFDVAVAAGGYNSVHELLYAGLPTLFVPNRSSGTDDQVARTRWLAENDYALFADESDLEAVRAQARRLHAAQTRAALAAACAELPPPSGSAAAAKELTALTGRRVSHRPSLYEAEVWLRAAAMRTLGPTGTALARRALRRSGDAGPTAPLAVRIVDEQDVVTPTAAPAPLVVTERLATDLLRAGNPVEHVLSGTSEEYRHERVRIAHRYYHVRGDA